MYRQKEMKTLSPLLPSPSLPFSSPPLPPLLPNYGKNKHREYGNCAITTGTVLISGNILKL